MVNDPIADLLVRIKNAGAVKNPETTAPYSKVKEAILKVLAANSCIAGYQVVTEDKKRTLVIRLKYTAQGRHVIRGVQRFSSPGCHFYVSSGEIPRWVKGRNRLGIISTHRGIWAHHRAMKENTGGELLGIVWK